jgi:hypothetical protein
MNRYRIVRRLRYWNAGRIMGCQWQLTTVMLIICDSTVGRFERLILIPSSPVFFRQITLTQLRQRVRIGGAL